MRNSGGGNKGEIMTETEIQKWLDQNTHYCELYKVRSKPEDCKQRIKAMEKASFVTRELDPTCFKCPVFGGHKKEEVKKKGSKMSEATKTLLKNRMLVSMMTVDEIVAKWGFKKRQVYEAVSRHGMSYKKVYNRAKA